jgi:hypothetical protein
MQRINEEVEALKKAVSTDPQDRPKQVLLASKVRDLTRMKQMKSLGEPWVIGAENSGSERRLN